MDVDDLAGNDMEVAGVVEREESLEYDDDKEYGNMYMRMYVYVNVCVCNCICTYITPTCMSRGRWPCIG